MRQTVVIEVVGKVLPIILLIMIGIGFKRWQFLQPGTVVELKKIVINVGLPALLFMAFANVPLNRDTLLISVTIFASMALMFGVGFVIKRVVKSNNRYLPAYFTSFETGMIGYSLYATTFGQEHLFKLAIVDLGGFIFMFFVLMGFLQQGSGERVHFGNILRSLATSPIVISVFVGIVLSTSGVLDLMKQQAVTNGILDLIGMLGSLTVPLICIAIGYELQLQGKGMGKPLAMAVTRMALWLVVAAMISVWLIDRTLDLDKGYQLAVYTMLILPPSFGVPIFIPESEKANKQLLLQAISIHIVLAILVFMVIASL